MTLEQVKWFNKIMTVGCLLTTAYVCYTTGKTDANMTLAKWANENKNGYNYTIYTKNLKGEIADKIKLNVKKAD